MVVLASGGNTDGSTITVGDSIMVATGLAQGPVETGALLGRVKQWYRSYAFLDIDHHFELSTIGSNLCSLQDNDGAAQTVEANQHEQLNDESAMTSTATISSGCEERSRVAPATARGGIALTALMYPWQQACALLFVCARCVIVASD